MVLVWYWNERKSGLVQDKEIKTVNPKGYHL